MKAACTRFEINNVYGEMEDVERSRKIMKQEVFKAILRM